MRIGRKSPKKEKKGNDGFALWKYPLCGFGAYYGYNNEFSGGAFGCGV